MLDHVLNGQINPFRHYAPRGAAAKLLFNEQKQVLLSGPAGTGKSRGCLDKGNFLALNYPGSRGLIVRKTRESLTESALFTFERYVLGEDNPICQGAQRKGRQNYLYPNKSEIIVGGLKTSGKDTTEKIMSTEYDWIYAQEATELSDEERQRLTTRLRNYVIPYQQLMMDCNPSYPDHPLKLACNDGTILYLESHHEDNPRLYDIETGDWTPEGQDYIAGLDALQGVLKQRLRYGKWVQAEGVVYDNFTSDNITDKEPNPELEIFIAYDDGYIDPRVFLFIQQTPTEILVFDEMYHSRHLAGTCVQEALDRCKEGWGGQGDWTKPELAIGSSEAKELQGQFRKVDIVARGGTHKPITNGIEIVRRLICDSNGYRVLKVHRRCKNFIRELSGAYRYPDGNANRKADVPVDADNHCCDAFRYFAWMRARRQY